MSWIEPLALETWFIQVFSGDATIFAVISLITIVGLCAYFRMTGMAMGFMVGVFMLMFSAYIPSYLLIFLAVISGLGIGWWISRIVK